MTQVCIAQVHFSISFLKYFLPLGDFLRTRGLDVKFLLPSGYRSHIPERQVAYCEFMGASESSSLIIDTIHFAFGGWLTWVRLFQRSNFDFLILFSTHPLSPAIFFIGRILAPRCKLVLCIHEPETRKSVVSLKARMAACIREALQGVSVVLCHDVVLFSPFAEKLFRKKYRHFKGDIHQTCLVVSRVELPVVVRDAVNMANKLYPDGRDRLFADLVCFGKDIVPELKFRLVTGDDIDGRLGELAADGAFELVNPDFLSDEMIIDSINRAKVQILGHRNITQSGVLPLAFQCGTPVLARDLPGFSQFVRHKENGYLVPLGASLEKWLEGIQYILDHFDAMSEACRRSYDELFAPENLEEYYGWVLFSEGVERDSGGVARPL
jgi:hypothetical protein